MVNIQTVQHVKNLPIRIRIYPEHFNIGTAHMLMFKLQHRT